MTHYFNLNFIHYGSQLSHNLARYRKKELFSDSMLICQDKSFPVHSLVLSLCSEFFEDMFSKIQQSPNCCLTIKDIDATLLDFILQFMYTGSVTIPQSSKNEFIRAAQSLKVKGFIGDAQEVTYEAITLSGIKESLNRKPLDSTNTKKLDIQNNFVHSFATSVLEHEEIEMKIEPIYQIQQTNQSPLHTDKGLPEKTNCDNQSAVTMKMKVKKLDLKKNYSPDPLFHSNVHPRRIGNIFTCPLCGLCSSHEVKMKRHIYAKHSRQKWFNCDFCTYKTNNNQVMSEHKRALHSSNLALVPQASSSDYIAKCSKPQTLAIETISEGSNQPEQCPISFKDKFFTNSNELLGQEKRVEAASEEEVNETLNEKKNETSSNLVPTLMQNTEHDSCITRHSIKKLIARKHTSGKFFNCKLCPFATNTKEGLTEHMTNAHGKNLYLCRPCGFSTKKRSSMKNHIEEHHQQDSKPTVLNYEPFEEEEIPLKPISVPCKLCPFEAKSVRSLKMHNLHKHKICRTDSKKCAFCPFTHQSKIVQIAHKKAHFRKSFKCPFCYHLSPTKHHLSLHVRVHTKRSSKSTLGSRKHVRAESEHQNKPEEGEFGSPNSTSQSPTKSKRCAKIPTISALQKCLQCNFKTFHPKALKIHLEAVHQNKAAKSIKRILLCKYCPFVAGNNHFMKIHETAHSVKHYNCQFCNYISVTKGNIIFHEEKKHKTNFEIQEEKPVKWNKCSSCSFKTFLPKTLERHLQTVHHLFQQDEKIKKAISCSLCAYTSRSNYNLKVHERAHSLPHYKCKFCPYISVHQISIPTHENNKHKKAIKSKPEKLNRPLKKKKNGLVLVRCSICPYEGRQCFMKAHERTHSMKHNKCQFCHYISNNGVNITTHEQKMHFQFKKVDEVKIIYFEGFNDPNVAEFGGECKPLPGPVLVSRLRKLSSEVIVSV